MVSGVPGIFCALPVSRLRSAAAAMLDAHKLYDKEMQGPRARMKYLKRVVIPRLLHTELRCGFFLWQEAIANSHRKF